MQEWRWEGAASHDPNSPRVRKLLLLLCLLSPVWVAEREQREIRNNALSAPEQSDGRSSELPRANPGDGVILMGPPGAGKGTQATFLRDRYHLQPLSPGDLLRKEVKDGSELGKQAKGYMDAGELVPDELILKIVGGKMDQLKPGEGFLLDGFPRSEAQAELLDSSLKERGRGISSVILITVEDKVIVQRLSQRRVCAKCGTSYNLVDNPPREAGICDLDGTQLTQRSDDSAETIAKRLQVYHESTAPVVEHYSSQGLVHQVDGEQPIDTVRKELEALLDPVLLQPASTP